MKIFKFKKIVEIEKNIGNLKLQTFHYGSFDENGELVCRCPECPFNPFRDDEWDD